MQEYRHPQIAGTEVDRRKKSAQRCCKHALHQHTEGCRTEDIGQVRRTKQHTGQKAGLPHTGAAGAKVLQQGLGNDTAEDEFLGHTHHGHADKEGADACRRLQHAVLRPAQHQRPKGIVANEHQRVHAHQQAIEKAAAAAAQQPSTVCPYQKQHCHHGPHQLLQSAVEVCINGRKIRPKKNQCNGKDKICYEQACQKDHFCQNAE